MSDFAKNKNQIKILKHFKCMYAVSFRINQIVLVQIDLICNVVLESATSFYYIDFFHMLCYFNN